MTIVLSVLLRFTASDYLFGIFKLFKLFLHCMRICSYLNIITLPAFIRFIPYTTSNLIIKDLTTGVVTGAEAFFFISNSFFQDLLFLLLFEFLLHIYCYDFCKSNNKGYSIQYYVIKFVNDLLVRWFSPGTAVFCTNKTDRHDIAEILLKVALNTINHKSNNKVKVVFAIIIWIRK